uniref:Uncharacterized protein n=1 Tax=Siphoviridae sp. ct7EW56 TaxID=2827562 RepID=A0A8S5LRQ0_9CAUD|nr:MAG TPA: hypothetical protein [Siphoviridae sp. ct7EW56]
MKFCNHARTPGQISRTDTRTSSPGIQTAQHYIRHLCNMPTIRNRSAQTISTRCTGPGVDRPRSADRGKS